MRRTRAHRHAPSIIASDLDHRFSPSHASPNPESASESDHSETDKPSTKRRKANAIVAQSKYIPIASRIAHCPSIAPPTLSITYLVTVTSAIELQKPANKRVSKAATIQLKSDDEWDTFKAQLLVQIESALQPRPLELELHTVKAYMPRIMPKPGWPLANEDQYLFSGPVLCMA